MMRSKTDKQIELFVVYGIEDKKHRRSLEKENEKEKEKKRTKTKAVIHKTSSTVLHSTTVINLDVLLINRFI
jgi:hypothetical protein